EEIDVYVQVVVINVGQALEPFLLDRRAVPVEPVGMLLKPGVPFSRVTHDDIEHDLESVLMGEFDESAQRLTAVGSSQLRAAKMRIDALEIERMVAVVTVRWVQVDRGQPEHGDAELFKV